MAAYKVVLRRRWFGEELEQKLAEYDRLPETVELLDLARQFQLGENAVLYVLPQRGKGESRTYTVQDLIAHRSA